jgi:hypothetical protein
MDKSEIIVILKDISDRLIPELGLDTYEQSIYWWLFRQTHLQSAHETTVSYADIQKSTGVTKTAATRRLRSLEEKKCIKVTDTGWGGTKVTVSLPKEILGVLPTSNDDQPVDIEGANFFTQEKYRQAILKRENYSCFYCLKKLTSENYALDHIVPQKDGGNDSYRNVVAACHSCNSAKHAVPVEDYLRRLLRTGRISDNEFDERLLAVDAIKQGEIKPVISG